MLSGVSRRWLSFAAVFGFVTIILFFKTITRGPGDNSRGSPSKQTPDYAQYIHVRTLSDEEVRFEDLNRRLIIVGDIHGMKKSLDKLLKKLSYSEDSDLLIHAGDIMTKGPDPFGVVSFLAENNIAGVRGNHDQKIIQWKAWVDVVLTQAGGQEWLERREDDSKLEIDPAKERDVETWKLVPEGWKFMGPHYQIARQLSRIQYDYLRSLPLVLHIPSLHAFVAHAGILPFDPRRSVTWQHQPLAHLPGGVVDGNVTLLRMAQEHAVLEEVPQNNDPWALLNMRNILKDGTITRETEDGTFWADMWNSVMKRCGGFEPEDETNDYENIDDRKLSSKKQLKKPLPCLPSTVIYGHTASQGLDVRRWTMGLDSGCVYGRRLSSLVLAPPEAPQEDYVLDELLPFDSAKKDKMRFGDDGFPRTANARIVTVSCPEP